MKRKLTRKIKEGAIETILFLSALSSVFITISIVVVLSYESFGFFKEVPLIEFLTGREWTPLFAEPKFGILPLIAGTLLTTFIALIVALPLGLT
ncbi:MAG: phosphate ABC transporter permease subunit PstC, partial [Nitrospirota bacterium]